jgi:Protein of unknown function (DUF1488)
LFFECSWPSCPSNAEKPKSLPSLRGVHFEMLDDLSERVRCFHTRAGFEKLARAEYLTEAELRRLFIVHREALERLASALYEAPASDTT